MTYIIGYLQAARIYARETLKIQRMHWIHVGPGMESRLQSLPKDAKVHTATGSFEVKDWLRYCREQQIKVIR